MQQRYQKHTRTFIARGATGDHEIHVYTEYIRTFGFGNAIEDVEGLNELVTADGEHVNWLKKGEYQIVATGEVITSSSPDAL